MMLMWMKRRRRSGSPHRQFLDPIWGLFIFKLNAALLRK
jgi:hypothetical protein